MDANDIVRRLSSSGEPAVLATIVGAEGHSYRKSGAMMLFLKDGEVGSVSPGCLEADLRARVPSLLETGRCETVEYNTIAEEDAFWGEAIGCGGRLRILLEPVTPELRQRLRETLARQEAGETVRLLRYRTSEGGMRYELSGEREPGAGRSGRRPTELYATTVLPPRPRLLLFGAGRDVDPLFALARRIGFRLAVADWREGLLAAERFPEAELAAGGGEAIVRSLRVGSSDYVVIGGHQLNRDREMLETLLPLAPAYLGVIGSRRRVERLFENLPMPSFVRAPAGQRIAGDGPEEIAVSIAAELIEARSRNRRRGGGDGDEFERRAGDDDRDGDRYAGDGLAGNGDRAGGGTKPAHGAAQAVP